MANSDEEQVELLRTWLRENGLSLIAGALLAVAGVVGWQQWGAWEQRQLASASAWYNELVQAIEQERGSATIDRLAETLMSERSATPYAALAALRLAAYRNRDTAAGDPEQPLRWLVAEAEEPALRALARERLATWLVARGSAEEALALLTDNGPGDAYASRYDAIRGDAHRQLGDPASAARAYDRALESAAPEQRVLLLLKREDLAGDDA